MAHAECVGAAVSTLRCQRTCALAQLLVFVVLLVMMLQCWVLLLAP